MCPDTNNGEVVGVKGATANTTPPNELPYWAKIGLLFGEEMNNDN